MLANLQNYFGTQAERHNQQQVLAYRPGAMVYCQFHQNSSQSAMIVERETSSPEFRIHIDEDGVPLLYQSTICRLPNNVEDADI
jgi:hypothetical protein